MMSEKLAKEIRECLGAFNDDNLPVTTLVKDIVEKVDGLEKENKTLRKWINRADYKIIPSLRNEIEAIRGRLNIIHNMFMSELRQRVAHEIDQFGKRVFRNIQCKMYDREDFKEGKGL